ncbi:MAG: malate dehydrogenase [Candidatus Omnitrophica bacterium]|jgi:malate dehydrogenase|nr:malate dehydrogenase [Candidatus Omnitrophota bacterium]MDD4981624.1 malate dehydrogenase [Candidatus Omnitrophota bacterium]MDD5665218.1 malate dehydrogenase [Candidatus Omnitrophota bacterium]
MKISVIGAGNVGSLTAMRLAQACLGDIMLVDIAKGLALGKSLDLEDARWILNSDYNIKGTEDIGGIKGSDIVVITAGLARKPGMSREDLLLKNSQILKEVSLNVKSLCPGAIVIVVTNPLDLMTYFVLKVTGFDKGRVFGMGISLDAARFANIIANEFSVSVKDVEAVVIGAHGEAMLPLPGQTKIKGLTLNEFADKDKIELVVNKTVKRGAEIVAALGTGSAFFAPSAAVAQMVRAMVRGEEKVIGACAYLDGEYGIKDICIGVPCRLGKNGIEEIIELNLNSEEAARFKESANSIGQLLKGILCMI